MAETVVSPREFIQDSFAPRLACLWSEDVAEICGKNNLTFLQLIHPFCRAINCEMIASDLTNRRFYVKNLSLNLCSIEEALAPSGVIARSILHDRVAQSVQHFLLKPATPSTSVDVSLKQGGSLKLSGSCPWYEAFRDEYVRLFPVYDYECIRDFLGCVFVVSSSSGDAVGRAKHLIEQQVQQQANQKYPRWFGPNIIKFFIVVEDLSLGSEESRSRGESAMQYFSSTYGENCCYLLKINSGSQKAETDPWNPTAPISSTNTTTLKPDMMVINGVGDDGVVKEQEIGHHPLLGGDNDMVGEEAAPVVVVVGRLLGQDDVQTVRDCIHALITKCLLPYAERQIRILNELIISKKGIHRTLVNATKKIFGPSGPSRPAQKASSNSNLSQVVYAGEAVELHNRKAGDLSFMLQLYDQALSFYQSARRDYSADQAWNYYAAASEMCGLAAFLSPSNAFSTTNARSFPMQYFESAIKSYSDVSKTSPQSVRAIIFASEVCRGLHLYQEAASFFRSRTPDDFDLLYGLFLEQAGHCYLRLAQAQSTGRYAFHMILAGFRYFKATQRQLGILVYEEALKVLEGRRWIVAEDHIRLNIVRHYMALRMFPECLPHFVFLLTGVQRQVASQQLAILKDYIACHGLVHGDVAVDELKIPLIEMQQIRTVIGRLSDIDSHAVQVVDEEWLTLEEKTMQSKGYSSTPSKPQQFVFSHLTDNRARPLAAVGETVSVEIPVKNPLAIPLLMSSLQLQYEFHPKPAAHHQHPAATDAHIVAVTAEPLELRLGGSESSRLTFSLVMSQPGALMITGLSYTLTAQSDSPDEVVAVSGRQKFIIQGSRLNVTKQDKMAVHRAPDHRLEMTVLPGRAKLVAKWDNLPGGLLAGQVVRLSLTIENTGQRPADHVCVCASLADVLVFFNAPKEDDVVTLAIPGGSIESGKKVTVTAVFVAPPVAATYCLRTLLYYQTAVASEDGSRDKKHHHHHHHVWRMEHEFKVLPGLTLQGFSVCSVASRQQLLLSLQVVHVNQLQLQGIPIQLLEVLSLNSAWHLTNLGHGHSGDGALLPNQETFLSILAYQQANHTASEDLSGFSVPSQQLDASDQSFRKAARSLASCVRSGPSHSDPTALILRLLWKVSLTSEGKPTTVYGIRFITFPTIQQTSTSNVPDMAELMAKLPDEPFIWRQASQDDMNGHFDVVDWRVELPLEERSLSGQTAVIVPLKVHLSCASSLEAEAVIDVSVEFRTAVKCFPVACRKQTVVLRAGGVRCLSFDYAFTAAGTYNMAELVYVKAICPLIPELKVAKLQKPSLGQNQMLLRIV